MTTRLGKGQGEGMMWESVRVISDAIERGMSDKDKQALFSELYGMLSGGHYDEERAVEAVAKMYYTDRDREKRYAPYWTIPQIDEIYESVSGDIPSAYNGWDFYVTFNMVASDNWRLLHEWWPNITQEQFADKITDLTVNWLSDEDNPWGDKKIWGYLND